MKAITLKPASGQDKSAGWGKVLTDSPVSYSEDSNLIFSEPDSSPIKHTDLLVFTTYPYPLYPLYQEQYTVHRYTNILQF